MSLIGDMRTELVKQKTRYCLPLAGSQLANIYQLQNTLLKFYPIILKLYILYQLYDYYLCTLVVAAVMRRLNYKSKKSPSVVLLRFTGSRPGKVLAIRKFTHWTVSYAYSV